MFRAMAATDMELLDRWRGGDGAAGSALFERHYASVARFFRNKLAVGAEDAIQETFLALMNDKERFRGESSFRTYLFGVAHNVLRYHCRKFRRDLQHQDFAAFTAQDLAPGPSTIASTKSEQALLLQGLRGIPLDHQIVLELYFWEPMTAGEIAEVLGEPEGTIRTRIRRAKELLREQLQVLAHTPGLLESTSSNLEDWMRSLREQAGL